MKNKKINVVIAVCMFSTALFTTGFAQKDSKKVAIKENEKKMETTKMEADAEFVVNAVDAGQFEILASELAKMKSTSQKVKDLASQCSMDHTKANFELKNLAMKKNITVPAKISDKYQKKFDYLNKEKSADFDKEYLREMVSTHKEDVELFQKEADKGKMAELKSWAAGKIPLLKKHLEMAESELNVVKEVSVK